MSVPYFWGFLHLSDNACCFYLLYKVMEQASSDVGSHCEKNDKVTNTFVQTVYRALSPGAAGYLVLVT